MMTPEQFMFINSVQLSFQYTLIVSAMEIRYIGIWIYVYNLVYASLVHYYAENKRFLRNVTQLFLSSK